MSQSSELSLFPPNDAEQWKEHWRTQGLPWRTEPEISKERQEELAQLRSIAVDVIRKVYPFKDIGLSRADIEWLLITHESEGIYGPVIYNDERHWKRRGIDIRGAYLAQVNLRDLPLTRMLGAVLPHEVTGERKAVIALNLDKADLTGAHLEEAFLAGSSLKRANLTGANLEMASLEGAHLEGANLSEAQMAEVNLTHAHLENAVLIKAHVEEANCRGAFLEGANFGEGHLEGADLKETSLAKTRFTRAHLEGADLRRARAGGGRADFHATHLEGANLEETSLEKADFRDAHLEGALLGEAHLEGADFRKAYLAGADLRAAHLEGADLKETHLEGKSLRPSDVKRIREWLQDFPEVLWPADLREALFSSETRLKDAILGDKERGFVLVADVSWGNVNLNVLHWDSISQIGDEQRARKRFYSAQDRVVQIDEYHAAVRANRQLSVELNNQGLNEAAARYSYNALVLQRLLLRKQRKYGHYLLSLFLDLLAGYGYKPMRGFIAYLLVIIVFMLCYYFIAIHLGRQLSWREAFVISAATAVGRGLIPATFSADDPTAIVSVFEAFIGLVIEATFIAALTQRFFGK